MFTSRFDDMPSTSRGGQKGRQEQTFRVEPVVGEPSRGIWHGGPNRSPATVPHLTTAAARETDCNFPEALTTLPLPVRAAPKQGETT